MVVRYYIPASSEAGARAVVAGIEIGTIPALPEYLDPVRAAENFDSYLPTERFEKRLWCIERWAGDDGYRFNAWRVDRIGQAAASIAFLYAGCWLVGLGTVL